MNIIKPIYKLAVIIKKKLLYLLGASTVGVRAIVLNEKNEILLVRHTYNNDWYLPGGGVNNNETSIAAIIRELQEETGIQVIDPPTLLGVYHHKILQVNDYPILYLVKNFTQEAFSSPEIAATGWFDFNKLPENTSPATLKRLNEYFIKTPGNGYW